jgi:hypothetical protein
MLHLINPPRFVELDTHEPDYSGWCEPYSMEVTVSVRSMRLGPFVLRFHVIGMDDGTFEPGGVIVATEQYDTTAACLSYRAAGAPTTTLEHALADAFSRAIDDRWSEIEAWACERAREDVQP